MRGKQRKCERERSTRFFVQNLKSGAPHRVEGGREGGREGLPVLAHHGQIPHVQLLQSRFIDDRVLAL